MKTFKTLSVNPVYDSLNDIVDFYNIVLSRTVIYRRASGYFSHKLLRHISKGIINLIKNNGTFYLIMSNQIDDETLEKIINGSSIDQKLIKDWNIDNLENEDLSDLAFLMSIGLIKIKIAFSKGIYHEKYGLAEDSEGNVILFSGSNNETSAALMDNFESFETTISWDSSKREKAKIDYRLTSFNQMWENEHEKVKVYDIPHAIIEKIIIHTDIDKTISKIREDIPILYFDYDANFKLYYNFDIEFKSWYKSEQWKRIVRYNDSQIVFDCNISFKSITQILSDFNKYIKEKFDSSIKIIYSNKLKEFLEINSLDFIDMIEQGNRIKNLNYFDTIAFQDLKVQLNSLIKRPLRDAQIRSADMIISLKRSMNFSVPGSGKTASVLASFKYLKKCNKVRRLLVLGPKNCFKSWVDEAYFVLGMDKDKIIRLDDSSDYLGKRISLQYQHKNSEIILMNFNGAINGGFLLKKYVDSSTMVVFDEIHRLKKIDGVLYRNNLDTISLSTYRVALTGTPLPNGYLDLYNQLKLLFGDYTETYFHFSKDYLVRKDSLFKRTGDISLDISNLIMPFYIRVSKDDLAIPKPQNDEFVIIKEDENKLSNYVGKHISFLQKLKIGIIPENIIHNHDVFISEQDDIELTRAYFDPNLITYKMEAFLKLVEKILLRNESVVVWLNFVSSIEKIRSFLNVNQIKNSVIYGITPQEEREEIIDSFNNGETRVLLTNPHTLAESVSLHKICNNAIYLELNYNLSQYLQSRDRIHRLGIENGRKTNYYFFITDYNGTLIEKRIYDVLNDKKYKMSETIEQNLLLNKYTKDIIDFVTKDGEEDE